MGVGICDWDAAALTSERTLVAWTEAIDRSRRGFILGLLPILRYDYYPLRLLPRLLADVELP